MFVVNIISELFKKIKKLVEDIPSSSLKKKNTLDTRFTLFLGPTYFTN